MIDYFDETKTDPKDWHVSSFDLEPDTTIISEPKYAHEGDRDKCDLCGTKIIHNFFINHDERKLSAVVGSECIKKFLVGNENDDFANKLKRITSKESCRKLKIRIYNKLVSSLEPFFESYERALEFGMPEIDDEWHILLSAMVEAKLSQCGKYASVWSYPTLKSLDNQISRAEKEKPFKIVSPQEWYDLNFKKKPPLDFDLLIPKIRETIEYCKSTDSPIKMFAVSYNYRFSHARKQCKISKPKPPVIKKEDKPWVEVEGSWL